MLGQTYLLRRWPHILLPEGLLSDHLKDWCLIYTKIDYIFKISMVTLRYDWADFVLKYGLFTMGGLFTDLKATVGTYENRFYGGEQ